MRDIVLFCFFYNSDNCPPLKIVPSNHLLRTTLYFLRVVFMVALGVVVAVHRLLEMMVSYRPLKNKPLSEVKTEACLMNV